MERRQRIGQCRLGAGLGRMAVQDAPVWRPGNMRGSGRRRTLYNVRNLSCYGWSFAAWGWGDGRIPKRDSRTSRTAATLWLRKSSLRSGMHAGDKRPAPCCQCTMHEWCIRAWERTGQGHGPFGHGADVVDHRLERAPQIDGDAQVVGDACNGRRVIARKHGGVLQQAARSHGACSSQPQRHGAHQPPRRHRGDVVWPVYHPRRCRPERLALLVAS